ncbi:adenine DNA glycosylase, partial [Haematococcus lacustris]
IQRSYLLVQRPESGLLAGLWEFPGVVLAGQEAEPTLSQRQQALDSYLDSLCHGSDGKVTKASSDADAAPPWQTNLVERITVRVADIRELEAKLRGTTRAQGSAPACDGSSNADVGGGGEGLSTGPRNIFQLACGEPELVKRLGRKKAQ